MNILDVLNGPWAIEPSRLLELQAIYASHFHGEAIDIAAVEKRLGRPLANEQRSYEIIDGVAVLAIEGVLAKKMNMFSEISGGASYQKAQASLDAALADPAVHSIILSIDSPGGTVDGTELLANDIRAARSTKPIVTLAGGTIASAAYWVGSAASAVYIADSTTNVGSIGVVTSHTDISAQEAARGRKTTELTAGRYKRIASQYGELTDEGRDSIQGQLDYMYSLFVGAVAENLGVSVETVLNDMADGRVFIGQQAIDAGLVHGITTLDALVQKLNADRFTSPNQTGAAVRAVQLFNHQGGTMTITAEQVLAQTPAVAEQFRAEGAATERARIQAVEAQSIPGHEALIASMKFDGKSNAGDAAMAVLAAEKAGRAKHVAANAADAPNPLPQAPAATVPPAAASAAEPPSRADLDGKAREYQAAHPGTSYVAAYKAVGGQ
jgi:signal peptide peptidase SppA